jgi:ElaB/YqjD/DUF883 family membrane-anchored ribosome-binding protein
MFLDGCRRANDDGAITAWFAPARKHGAAAIIAAGDGRRYATRCRPIELPLPKESTMNLSRETLLDDFSTMLSEAEDLLKRASNETGERAKDLRAQVEAKLLAAKLRLQELEGEAMDRARAAARVTDDYVHDNPWRAIGAAVAAGFLIGLLVNRR